MIRRLAFLIPAGVALLAGLDAGLLLLGLPAPVTTERLPDAHGMVLTLGFVGTVIALERAVALRRRAGFAAPALLGVGGLLVTSSAPLRLGQLAMVAGTAALVALYIPLWRRQRDDAVLVQAFGAVLATGGAVLWLGGMPVAQLLPWLAGFIVLTIAGERLELARVMMLATSTVGQLLGLCALITLGTVGTLLWPATGYPVLGLSLLALVAWLTVHDIARRTIRAEGLPRFMAGCLLAGYAWLAVAGTIWTLTGGITDGPTYDAVIHAIFLGFTMSMIMAHAPVILPAVLGCRLPYHPVMIASPVLLHASLILRLAVGDVRGVDLARQIGGGLNVVALLGFAVITAVAAIRATRTAASPEAAQVAVS
ncbi:MAG: hypothetical protein QOE58_2763 [Actinomycetota bacterium]|jgi:hypothetical protein|nr:hypothetical protein [Actinomycetota bacterium]